MRKSRIGWVIALILGLSIGATVTWLLMKPGNIRNGVSIVVPGELYRSGQLDPDQLRQEIRQRGIKTVINLGSSKDWDQAVCQSEGVTYIPVALGDVWQLAGAPNPEHGNKIFPAPDMTPVWDAIDQAGSDPVLFHCWGGTHRTGMITAMVRIQRQGWSPQDAINEMKLFGFNIDDPKYAGALDFLRQLKPDSTTAPSR